MSGTHNMRRNTGGLSRIARRVTSGWLILLGLACTVLSLWMGSRGSTVLAATPLADLQHPDTACIRCHREITESYGRTAMGRGSGLAMAGLIPGSFQHERSGVSYRIAERDGRGWMSFDRPATTAAGPLHGERELRLYVGSGTHGRTYLYEIGGAWFQLPVNFYRRGDRWAMAPSFDSSTRMPAPLPVDANCIHCHATAIETPLPQAANRFPQRPFDQGGIGCSACHGDPTAHLASAGKAAILNPDKLSVAARDSACIQCHLEGNAVVYKPGRSLAQFRPGDRLSDFAVYFVRSGQADGGQRASSQYEALLLSACKRASGDRLTCTSCHDPHREPLPADRVSFFRGRCLSCHRSPELATNHHPEQQDCAICHMPSRATVDISHEQVTDHTIQRRPGKQVHARKSDDDLVPVGGVSVGDRELGLAYAQLAQKGDQKAGQRAMSLLLRAEHDGADDAPVHLNLGFLQQISGNLADAAREYEDTLQTQPFNPSALTNRAVLAARQGHVDQAVQLLRRLATADPSQTSAGLDLAFIECQMGQVEESRELATRLQELNPDDESVRLFLTTQTLGSQRCRPAATSAVPSPSQSSAAVQSWWRVSSN